MKKIIILGDSFTFGQGCADRLWYWDEKLKKFIGNQYKANEGPSIHAWSNHLQKDYPNYKVINLAMPGTDNTTISQTAQRKIDADTALVILNSAPENRIQIKHYNWHMPTSWNLSAIDDELKAYADAQNMFVKHLYHPSVTKQLTVNAILSIIATCQYHNVKFIFGASEVTDLIKFSNIMKNMHEHNGILHIAELIYPSFAGVKPINEFFAPEGHVNEIGHEFYYNNVIRPRVNGYL